MPTIHNGNLVADLNKGIQVHYNYLNLVDTVFVNAGGRYCLYVRC